MFLLHFSKSILYTSIENILFNSCVEFMLKFNGKNCQSHFMLCYMSDFAHINRIAIGSGTSTMFKIRDDCWTQTQKKRPNQIFRLSLSNANLETIKGSQFDGKQITKISRTLLVGLQNRKSFSETKEVYRDYDFFLNNGTIWNYLKFWA